MTHAEMRIKALLVRCQIVGVEVIAMQANDAITASGINGGRYTEQAYLDKAQELRALHDEIQLYGVSLG